MQDGSHLITYWTVGALIHDDAGWDGRLVDAWIPRERLLMRSSRLVVLWLVGFDLGVESRSRSDAAFITCVSGSDVVRVDFALCSLCKS